MATEKQPQSGADILVQCLVNHGVEVVFAYPGGASTKHHYLVTRAEDLPRVMKEAFYIASTGRPGPVIVDVPKDVQNKMLVVNYDPAMNLPGYRPDRRASRQELEAVLQAIRASRRPIIYAGGGIIAAGATPQLRAFVDRTGIPVTLTVHGLGGFPSDHFLCLQMLGMHGTVFANYAINEADLLLALGVRFDDRVTGKVSEFAKHGKIVHIDIDPSEINKIKVAHLPIVGDVGLALQDLLPLLEEEPPGGEAPAVRQADWLRKIEHWRETEPLRFQEREDSILPQFALRRLWQILKGG